MNLFKEGININTLKKYAISYPKIKHPLMSESEELKRKYISALRLYANKFCQNNAEVSYMLETFSEVLLGKDKLTSKLFINDGGSKLIDEIFKTKFTPFRIYSYRYLFLFDSIFIMANCDRSIGISISKELKLNVNKGCHNQVDLMVEKMYSGELIFDNKKFITDEMVTEWNRVRSYIYSKNQNITFTATMSAGKSTLINAIMGRELSYAKKSACTSTVIKFITSPSKGELFNIFYKNKVKKLQSEEEVRDFTKNLEEQCTISNFFISTLSNKKITLIDTPGVNSSINPEHKKITHAELMKDSIDTLVYVIPVENYGSDGDFEHLTYIKRKVNYNKILFVINMMDSCDPEDDSVSEIVKNIHEHLINIGYNNPIICPMSAKAGMLIKQALFGKELSENDKKSCCTYIEKFQSKDLELGGFYPMVEKRIFLNDIAWTGTYENKIWEAYINTGIPGFEELLTVFTKGGEKNVRCND